MFHGACEIALRVLDWRETALLTGDSAMLKWLNRLAGVFLLAIFFACGGGGEELLIETEPGQVEREDEVYAERAKENAERVKEQEEKLAQWEKEQAAKEAEERAADEKERLDEFRTWTDSTGAHTVEARYVKNIMGKITLEKRDKSTVDLDLDKLSEADREWIKNRKKD